MPPRITGIGPNPSGFCKCNCGGAAPICTKSDSHRGYVVGKPLSYIDGHQVKAMRAARATHGLSHTPEWKAYWGARERCTNPDHPSFKNYGGRGIKFLFKDFESFLAHVGQRPSRRHSIDRLENDGNYEVGNLAWRTRSEQQRNKRPGIRERKRSSRFLGVYWNEQRKKWYAQCTIDQKRFSIGRSTNEKEAALLRDAYVIEHMTAGSYVLNFKRNSVSKPGPIRSTTRERQLEKIA